MLHVIQAYADYLLLVTWQVGIIQWKRYKDRCHLLKPSWNESVLWCLPFECYCFLYSVSILTLKFLSVTMLDITRRQDKYPHFCSPKAGTPNDKYFVVIELREKSCLRLGVVAYLPKATWGGPERVRDYASGHFPYPTASLRSLLIIFVFLVQVSPMVWKAQFMHFEPTRYDLSDLGRRVISSRKTPLFFEFQSLSSYCWFLSSFSWGLSMVRWISRLVLVLMFSCSKLSCFSLSKLGTKTIGKVGRMTKWWRWISSS